ncbi:MAG: galactose oxidase-like domain-containing protein, partial [Gammaproteobacteria bacterium]
LYPFMFVIPNGEVYEAGDNAQTWRLNLAGAGSWTAGPTNVFGSSGFSGSATTYRPGKIIRSGGNDPAIARAAVIDMTAASPQWREIDPMAFPRRRHNVVILADGQVMAVGGTRQSDSEALAVLEGEIWNPGSEQWTTVAPASEGRAYHSTAALLPDGRVVFAGGEMSGRNRAQIYSPPYLFKGPGPRPEILSSPDRAAYGSSFTVSMADSRGIASVALIRAAAVTHAFDHNQRYVPLALTQSGTDLAVTAPANSNIAPPGYYMLVPVDINGLPAIAAWVRLGMAADQQDGAIAGRVTDGDTGNPIPGATVAYSGGSTTTDPNGDYTLTGVPSGNHLVTVSAAGYGTVSKTVTVTGGAMAALDFALSVPGTIIGQVTDNTTGNPIGGATVT